MNKHNRDFLYWQILSLVCALRNHVTLHLPASPYARSKIAAIVNGVYILPLHEQVSLINIIF